MDRHPDHHNTPHRSNRDRGIQESTPGGPDFPIPSALSRDLTATGREFLVGILGAEVKRRPDNVPALTTLSQSLAQLDRRLEGLAVDRKLAHLKPESAIVLYNLACSEALNQNYPAALDSLTKAISFGFDDAGFMASDPDLENLHPLKTFRSLVEELGQRQPTRPDF